MAPYETLDNEMERFQGNRRSVGLNFNAMSERKVYNIPTEWQIRTMILNVQTWAKKDFVSLRDVNECEIEVLVVVGERESVLEEEVMSVKQKFCNVYEIVSFVVRKKVRECSICLDERVTGSYFGCRHRICAECNDSCVATSHNRCPECRSVRLFHRVV